jgi:eukaryotic-like serine/threonine-protein kinase
MAQVSAEKIAQRALDLGLLDERQLQGIWASFGSRNVRTREFLQALVRREFLTNYQVERLTKGEKTGFFYGDYKILYLVGTGTFARVFRAVHRETEQVVAVKVLRNRFSEDPRKFGQFIREGRVGCTLRHPNIVPVYEVYSQGKTHFLVMEFIEGPNLREFLKVRKRLEYVEASRLMIDIAQGLQYAFESGLTHRDLKMSNVLVSSRGQAKLVDFGLAALDEALSGEFQFDNPNARTIDYAALERVTGVRKDDTRSDIYFMGCIYYHLITGVPPLPETRERTKRLNKTRFQTVMPIRQADPTIPDPVAMLVNKAMMLDPAKRYQSPGAMLSDLHLAVKRMESDPPAARAASDDLLAGEEQGPDNGSGSSKGRQRIMVVESNGKMQDVFRESFKRAGYRVLITGDPARALGRFQQDVETADCVVINAQQLGAAALNAFNQFGSDAKTKGIPVVLLLDENQPWLPKAATDDHRIVLRMPITMKQLRSALAKLVGPAPAQA